MVDKAMAPNLGGGMTSRGHLEGLGHSDCQTGVEWVVLLVAEEVQRHLNTLGHTGGTFSKHHPASRVNCAKMRNTDLELLRACQEHSHV